MIDKQLIAILDSMILELESKSDSQIQKEFELAKNGPVSMAFSGIGSALPLPIKEGVETCHTQV